ncbi:MAG: hypothetical protein ACK4IS_07215 [Erythrobacter sp.]
MIPRLSIARWDGQGDGLFCYAGWSLAIEWLGLIFEINFGRAAP